MYKLSFKLSKLGIIAPIILCAAAIVLPPHAMLAGYGNSFHVSVLFVILLGVAIVGAALLYDRGSKVQKYQVALTIFAASCFYGVLGNLFYNFWKWSPGAMIEFSYAQLVIMNLGGLLTTFALFKLEPFDTFAAGGLERLQKSKAHEPGQEPLPTLSDHEPSELSAEDFMKKPMAGATKQSQSSLKAVSTSKTDLQAQSLLPGGPQEAQVMAKKGGPSALESAQAIMTPPVEIDLDAADEMLSGNLNPSPTPVAKPGAPAAPAAEAKSSGNTGNRLQAQKRRNTSTFTKLQALSASGTGSLKPTAPTEGGTGSGDLRSLLDRLDAEPSDEDHEVIQSPEEIRAMILFDEAWEEKQAARQPSPVTPMRPMGQAPQNRPGAPAQGGGPRPTQIPVTPPRPQPGPGGPKPGGPGGPKPVAPAASAGGPATAGGARPGPGGGPPKPGSPGGSPGLASLLDRAEAMADDDEEEVAAAEVASVPEPAAKVEAVDETPEPIEEPEVGGLLSQRFAEMSEDEEPPQAKEEPEAVDEETPEGREEGEKVFSVDVDGDIDDIFSNLAPAESQREVGQPAEEEEPTEEDVAVQRAEEPQEQEESQPEPVEEEPEEQPQEIEEPAEAPAEEEEEERLFQQDVGSDVDDLFADLAPAESQGDVSAEALQRLKEKQVEEEAPATAVEAEEEPEREIDQELTGEIQSSRAQEEEEPEPAEAEEEQDESLFQLGDTDMDDIFAGLTEEKQLEVSAETLKKVQEKEEQEAPMPTSLVETGDRIPVINADSMPKSAKSTGDMPSMTPEQAAKLKEKVAKMETSTAAGDEAEEDDEESLEEEQEAPPESPEAAKLKKELKEFGKLSIKSANAPKPAGESVGTMKTIGKLLIDNTAIENIIKAGEQRKLGAGLSTARIISKQRGQGIAELLNKIDEYEGVFGSLIVGHDGLVMASTLKEGWDKDMMGALSTALLSTSNLTTKKLEIGKLRQMVMLTKINNQEKTTVLTDVDVGILAVFVEKTEVERIDGLLDLIHKTIHG